LLARPRRSEELEILLLRHEHAVLRLHAGRPRLTRADRALRAVLSRLVPRTAWTSLVVKPETLLRWYRQLVARRWTYAHRKVGRPPLERSLRELILRLARENPHWGYKRIVGELRGLGISVSATSVRRVLLEAGLQPAPKRRRSSRRGFLRAQAASVLACDFLTVESAFLRRIYVLFFISVATRRIEYVACTANPDRRWVAQQARNLVLELGDEQPFRLLTHDRDAKFSRGFDEVFRSEGIKVIRRQSRRRTQTPTPSAGSARSGRLPRPNPHRRPPSPRARASLLPAPLQRVQAASARSSSSSRVGLQHDEQAARDLPGSRPYLRARSPGRVGRGPEHVHGLLALDNPSPNQHDYDQLAQIYAHLDSTSTVGSAVSVGAAGSAHASPVAVERSDRIASSTIVEHYRDGSKLVTRVLWAVGGKGRS